MKSKGIDKARGVNIARTICEVHREMYDIIAAEIKEASLEEKLVTLLNESYLMAKKMNAKLTQYKHNYDQDWWESNRSFVKSLKIRKNIKGFFLDCGAWNGYSVETFRKLYDEKCKYFIFSFEPNPLFNENFPKFKNHILYKEAVWIKDDSLNFFLDHSKDANGSTLIRSKKSGKLDKKHPIKVKCIDLDRWIKENFNKNDYIILKLDIEGAEYKVLSHMIENGSIDYINKLFIEWHWRKINLPQNEHKQLVKQLKMPIIEKWKLPK